MSSDKLFSNTLATNGLARGYDLRPHKRKRSGLRFAIVVLVALGVGAGVAFVGVVGFVGLVVPHCVRMLIGPDHRVLLWGSGLMGGLFMLLTDWLSRTLIMPAELPIGIVTAVVGGPFFIFLIVTRSREAGL